MAFCKIGATSYLAAQSLQCPEAKIYLAHYSLVPDATLEAHTECGVVGGELCDIKGSGDVVRLPSLGEMKSNVRLAKIATGQNSKLQVT